MVARPIKNNLPWFAHDNDMRNDKKIKAVRIKFGFKGYAIYNMVLEYLSEENLLRVFLTGPSIDIMAGDFGIEAVELTTILDYLVSPGIQLLQVVDNYLICRQLDTRAAPLFSKRGRDLIALRNLVSVTETPTYNGVSDATTPAPDGVSVTESPHSKVKKRKEDLKKEPGPPAGLIAKPQKPKDIKFIMRNAAGDDVPISSAFFSYVSKGCFGEYQACEAFFRARAATDPKAYIIDGMKTETIFKTRLSEEDGREKWGWIDRVIYPKASGKPQKISDILKTA